LCVCVFLVCWCECACLLPSLSVICSVLIQNYQAYHRTWKWCLYCHGKSSTNSYRRHYMYVFLCVVSEWVCVYFCVSVCACVYACLCVLDIERTSTNPRIHRDTIQRQLLCLYHCIV
jgi:hypothetical protein